MERPRGSPRALRIATPSGRHLRPRRTASHRGYTWSLPEDLHLHILALLPTAADLATAALVSTAWAKLAETDLLWRGLCESVWRGKLHVSGQCRELVQKHCSRRALRLSMLEARDCHITQVQLCALEWSFRFKRVAGSTWTSDDPWWNGGHARTLRFAPDGTVRWDDEAWDNGDMRWELEQQPTGSVLRVSHTVLGAFPGERLMRHASNWGYLWNSPWVVYSDFPMLKATDAKAISDRSLARKVEAWQWGEAEAYNEQSDDDEGA